MQCIFHFSVEYRFWMIEYCCVLLDRKETMRMWISLISWPKMTRTPLMICFWLNWCNTNLTGNMTLGCRKKRQNIMPIVKVYMWSSLALSRPSVSGAYFIKTCSPAHLLLIINFVCKVLLSCNWQLTPNFTRIYKHTKYLLLLFSEILV